MLSDIDKDREFPDRLAAPDSYTNCDNAADDSPDRDRIACDTRHSDDPSYSTLRVAASSSYPCECRKKFSSANPAFCATFDDLS